MTRSKIITEFINEDADIEKTMKRLKALLYNMDSSENLEWIDNELAGYPSGAELPEYRIVGYTVYGNIVAPGMQQPNRLLSVSNLSQDKELSEKIQKSLSIKRMTESIKTLKEGSKQDLYYQIPAELYGFLSNGFVQDEFCPIQVVGAHGFVSRATIIEILSTIERKVLDIMLLLEKEFGILDELDIQVQSETPEKIKTVNQIIFNIIHQSNTTTIQCEDNSIDIGNDNRITKSTIETQKDKE